VDRTTGPARISRVEIGNRVRLAAAVERPRDPHTCGHNACHIRGPALSAGSVLVAVARPDVRSPSSPWLPAAYANRGVDNRARYGPRSPLSCVTIPRARDSSESNNNKKRVVPTVVGKLSRTSGKRLEEPPFERFRRDRRCRTRRTLLTYVTLVISVVDYGHHRFGRQSFAAVRFHGVRAVEDVVRVSTTEPV